MNTSSQTATESADFDKYSAEITLSSTAPVCFDVVLKNDIDIEGNETFLVVMSSANSRVKFPRSFTIVHITDDGKF